MAGDLWTGDLEMRKWLMNLFSKEKTGTFEGIELTWGSHGHQLTTIDGKRYATWMSYEEFPKKGDTVTFTTYYQYGMLCADLKKATSDPAPGV